MERDALERELWIISTQLSKLSDSFGALAAELTKDRKFGSKSVMRGMTQFEKLKKKKDAQRPLPLEGPFA